VLPRGYSAGHCGGCGIGGGEAGAGAAISWDVKPEKWAYD